MKCTGTIGLRAFQSSSRDQLNGISTRKIFTLSTKRQSTTTTTTLSSHHPFTFLLHLTGITIGSISIPFIGQHSSNRAYSTGLTRINKNDRVEEEIITSITNSNTNLIEEIELEGEEGGEQGSTSTLQQQQSYIPQASPKQLRNLSNLLKQQLKSDLKIFDSLFTLRQLHMLKTPTFNSTLSSEEAEGDGGKWLWRLPATTAIHSIIKLANRQRYISFKESSKKPPTNLYNNLPELLSIAVKLASNALEHDTINRKILKESLKLTGLRDTNEGTKLFNSREYIKETVVDTEVEGCSIEDGLNSKDPKRVEEAKLSKEVENMWSEALVEALKARSTAIPHQHPHAPVILNQLEEYVPPSTSLKLKN